MEFKKDRGTVLEITFTILYPNGQLKHVTLSLSDPSKFKDVGIIAFDEEMIKKYLVDRLPQSALVLDKWNKKDVMIEDGTEAPFKPALILVEKNGNAILKCGGHGSSGHDPGQHPVNVYMS